MRKKFFVTFTGLVLVLCGDHNQGLMTVKKIKLVVLYLSISVYFLEAVAGTATAASTATSKAKTAKTQEEIEIDVFKLVEKGTPAQLRKALKAGAKFNVERTITDFTNVEIPDNYWPFDTAETPLHRAASFNHNPESIKFLIRQGLDVNATADVGNYASITPLVCAVYAKNIPAIKELLKAGADPNAWTPIGYNFLGTPFHIVAFEYGDNEIALAREIITELIKSGGDINAQDEIPEEDLKFLKEHEEGFAEHNTIFLPRDQWTGNDLNDPFEGDNMTGYFSHYAMGCFLGTFTPIMWGVIFDKPAIVDIFLEFNSSVNIRSVENKSAIDYANELPKDSRIKRTSVFKKLQKAAYRK